MKIINGILLLVIVCLSCKKVQRTGTDKSISKETQVLPSDSASTTAPDDLRYSDLSAPPEPNEITNDTFYFENKKIFFTPIKKSEFEAYERYAPHDTVAIDENDRLQSTERVKRVGDSLIFKLLTDKMVYLIDTLNSSATYAKFIFNDYQKFKNHWAVKSYQMEYHDIALVDKTNGNIQYLANAPVQLSDSLFVVINYDLEAGFVFNGFAFYGYDEAVGFTALAKKDPVTWGPWDFRRTPTDDILIEKWGYTTQGEFQKEYVRMHVTTISKDGTL